MLLTKTILPLIVWHKEHQRALPWRMTSAGQRDPYAVWVSEIMAQQTRIETVVAYYKRWMERFPSIRALADSDQQDVLKLWEGLGYYARARNLHKAAQMVVVLHDGVLPADRQQLLELPGIGAYTAGAILSMAFGQAEPLLDGNIKRVFSRLFDIEDPIDETDTLKALWDLSRQIVEAAPRDQAGIVNEALMELGALICTPRSPRCLLCPLAENCRAAASGTQRARPVRMARKKTPHYDVAAGVIWRGEPFHSQMLIAQRPQNGLLGGLWEFPGGKLEASDADLQACLQREIAEELAIEIAVGERVITVKHAYTHFRITLHAFHARHLHGEPQMLGVADWRWLDFEEVGAYPFPVTDQKIIEALQEERNQV